MGFSLRRSRVVAALSALGLAVSAAVATAGSASAEEVTTAAPCAAFSDVSATFCDDVTYLVDKGVARGLDATHFGADRAVNRAEAALFLYRLAHDGADAETCAAAPFDDVAADSTACGAIAWLAKQGITKGVDAKHFDPAGTVTRGQAAAMMYRMTKSSAAAECAAAPFSDVAVGHVFCAEIAWAADRSIVRGVDETHFRPNAAVTRGQMAALLHRTALTPDVDGVFSPTETFLRIAAGDHTVPGTLNVPAGSEPLPVVLMLHGTASLRDEVGNMYAREAAALAAKGIASLRIDFAGSGASQQPETALTYPSMVTDATAALRFLQGDTRFDSTKIAVLGFSRGSTVAASLVGANPSIAAFASWSGALANGVHEDPDNEAIAQRDGHVVVDLGFRTWDYSYEWFTSVAAARAFDEGKNYAGPFLGVVGSADDVVPPATTQTYIDALPGTDKTLHAEPGGDHIYLVLGPDQTLANDVITTTATWLAARLG